MLHIINRSLFEKEITDAPQFLGVSYKAIHYCIPKKLFGTRPGLDRKIVTLNSPYDEPNYLNLGIFSTYNRESPTKEYIPGSCYLKESESLTRNSIVLLVAFPFRGTIKPIPDVDQFRIYRGLLVNVRNNSSVTEHKGFSFNNILYLVIKLDERLFDPNNPKHVKEISIPFEAWHDTNYKKIEGVKSDIVYQSMVLNCTPNVCSYEYRTISKNDDPSNPAFQTNFEEFRGNKIYQLFTPVRKESSDGWNSKPPRRDNFNNRPAPHQAAQNTRPAQNTTPRVPPHQDNYHKPYTNTVPQYPAKPTRNQSRSKGNNKLQKQKEKYQPFDADRLMNDMGIKPKK